MHAFEDEWVRKHVFSAGVDFAITRGHLDGVSKINSSGNLEPETIILPKIPFFLVYAFDLRALANEHSVGLNFGYAPHGDSKYLRYGLEYQYHFFWPEPFRMGTGIGYDFSSVRSSEAIFSGNGPHAVLSAQYYFTENFAVESAIRYRLLHLNQVATDLNPGRSKLSEALWQGMGELGLRGMFVF
ncbi:MAG: hypothetical protein FWH22_05935 [Fibromonadales bacterium]|nr:hypothetical protein [Fibromonadales bacterium]